MANTPHLIVCAAVVGAMSFFGGKFAETPADRTASSDAATVASIDVGRLGAMLDQAEELLETEAAMSDEPAPAGSEAQQAFHQLQVEVLRYRLMLVHACDMGRAPDDACTHPYSPRWLNDAAGVQHNETELKSMVADASAHIRPLWQKICLAASKSGESACELE